MTSADRSVCVDLRVNFPSARAAEVVYNSLRVDGEPARGRCHRQLQLTGQQLEVQLQSSSVRGVRTAATSFFDLLVLATRTVEQFGPEHM